MTQEEREAVLAVLTEIVATLRQVEIKIDAAVDTLIAALPDHHQEYQKALKSNQTLVDNHLSQLGEYLRKTLGKSKS
jgi:hypothetical protein